MIWTWISRAKDSYELRKAGAAQTIVASEQRWALMTETPEKPELDLTWLVSRMDASKLDLVLVEGFKHEPVPKILLFGQNSGHRVEELVIDEAYHRRGQRCIDRDLTSAAGFK